MAARRKIIKVNSDLYQDWLRYKEGNLYSSMNDALKRLVHDGISNNSERFVIKNNRAFITSSRTGRARYESEQRTFRIMRSEKHWSIFEMQRKEAPQRAAVIPAYRAKKSQDAISYFSKDLTYEQRSEQSWKTAYGYDQRGRQETRMRVIQSNKLRRSQLNEHPQLICVVDVYDVQLRRSERFIGFSHRLSRNPDQKEIDDALDDAKYSAVGRYIQAHNIRGCKSGSARFIPDVVDSRIIYRKVDRIDYGRNHPSLND
jgi:hypothetical protein